MGGKHKQAQRIKNNARPSSSGRSAELLASTSHSSQFSSMKEIRFVPPTLSLLKMEEFDASVLPDFQVVFKKMNKKDSTTKIKALQEFGELAATVSSDAIKAILVYWATLYSVLTSDPDHRVREAVHNAHYEIVCKDRRLIAPVLKQLIGPWFMSQCDNYPPAASAARKTFTTTFPPNKTQDCIIFCHKEILTYFDDSLNSKLDANPKHGSTEDAEARYERIIVSTLQGYCLYLDTLTEEQIGKCADLNKKIISNSQFLKLSAHKTSFIRAAFFKVLAGLYHKAVFLLEGNEEQVVPVVFNNLDESEPSVVGFVWEAALLIMNSHQEWWKHINLEKTFLPKLKKVLKEGGQGSASFIYPNLLSLLHKLPETVQTEPFYDNFFENLRSGLKRKNVLASKSESAAIITAAIECLQYVILINETNIDLCEKLIKSHLLPLVELGLNGDQISYKIIFQKTASLVQYWTRNKNITNYVKYLDLFWDCLKSIFTKNELPERHVIFIQYLKSIKPKKLKVKFAEEGESSVPKPVELEIDHTYNNNLQNLVQEILRFYVSEIEEKKSKDLLQHLLALVKLFESREFLLGLNTEKSDLINIYEELLHKWLKSDELACAIVVDLAFVVLKYVPDEEKTVILTSFLEFPDDVLIWCVKNAFSHPYNQQPTVQKWLTSQKINDFLLTVTEANLSSDCSTDLKILFKLAFTESDDGELLIAKSTISLIINKIQAVLSAPKQYKSLDFCLHLASYVAQIIYSDKTLLKYGDSLLLSLFEFSCQDHADLENLTSDTSWEVNTTWQDIITILSKSLEKSDFVGLIGNFANLMEIKFLRGSNPDGFVNMAHNLIKSIFPGQPLMISEIFHLLFDRDFLPKCKRKIEEFCLRGGYLSGELTSDGNIFKKNEFVIGDDDVLNYFIWSYIKISVLVSPLEEDEDSKDVIYVVDNYHLTALDLLYDLAMCDSFLENYKMIKYFTTIRKYSNLIKEKIQIMFKKLDNFVLTEQLNTGEWLWAKAVQLFHQDINVDTPHNTYVNYTKQLTNNLSKINLCQIYGDFIDFDDIQLGPNIFENAVILRNLSHCTEIDVQIAEVFDGIKKLRSKNISKFLFENKDLTWPESQTLIEIIRLFSALIKNKFDGLSRQHWDFGVISLSAWASSCLKLRTHYENPQIQGLFVAVVDFYINLCDKMTEMKSEPTKRSFVEEWEDLFLPNIHDDLIQLWMYLSEQFVQKPEISLQDYTFLSQFMKLADYFNYKLVFSKENSTITWIKILKRCTSLLVHPSPILQISGYKILMGLVPGLIEFDLQTDLSNVPNCKGLTCEQFKQVLAQTNTIVDDLLTGFKLGEDSCQVTPFTDSYTYVFGYLLLWSVLLNLCEKSPPELRYQYADWLRNENYFKILLNNLFKLMPTEILQYNEGKAKAFLKLFTQEPELTFQKPPTSEQLEHVVCWIYTSCLSQLPALVRQWWSETETKVTQIVERVTSFYVSPQLCNQELQNVASQENKFKNMTVKTASLVREVIAIYTVDEAQMELVITLPLNYPLGGPDVRCNKQIGGPLHKQWLMQLKKYLLHQNGRVWDGLSLWNSSLDKKFDGVEECYICFAVLHPGTYQLPKLSCQTCKKKFHSACLYKWFSTSNKSSCPICRNLF